MRIGIDATNIGGGGGVTHLKEILANFKNDDQSVNIKSIVVFSSSFILNQLDDSFFIKKVTFPFLNKSLIHRILFQLFQFDKEISNRCDILFSITGDYTGSFKPLVGMSQNMLLYEREIWREINNFKEIFRFWVIFQKQKKCFKNSLGIIFISNFAKNYIINCLNLKNKDLIIINHGISPRFVGVTKKQLSIKKYSFNNPFKLLYVSTVHVYKHQWNVIKAVADLRQKGIPIELNLVGGIIFKSSGKKMVNTINEVDPTQTFIKYHGNILYTKIESFYKNTDGIIFASTCENMPNILIESMASGNPIVCSNKEPMPEFLKDGGFYFNSQSSKSIEKAILNMLKSPKHREEMIIKNLQEIEKYSWLRSSKETLNFLSDIYIKN